MPRATEEEQQDPQDEVNDDQQMVVEGEPQADADAEAAFADGFEDDTTETPAKSKTDEEGKAAAKPDVTEAKPGDKPAATTEKSTVVEPKLRQVTEDEWNALTAKAASVDSLRADMQKQLDKAFGLTGKLKQDLERAVQSKGVDIEVTDDLVAEMVKDFPEVGEATLGVFKKFANKLKQTAVAVQAVKDEGAENAVDPKVVEERIDAVKREMRAESAKELLSLQHDDWETVVGLPDEKGVVPDTEYRKWLAAQPPEYKARVSDSWNPVEIGKSISAFKKAQEKVAAVSAAAAEAAKRPSQRKQQLAAAVVRRGAGSPTGGSSDDAAEFAAGFNEE